MSCLQSAAQQPAEERVASSVHRWLKWASDGDSLHVSVSLYHDNEALRQHPRLVKLRTNIYIGWLTKADLLSLLFDTNLRFVNQYHPPLEELNTGAVDYTLNRIRKVQAAYPLLRGDSINIAIKERRFDSTDIDLKNRTFSTALSAAQTTSHAGLMATIVGGAGNTSPYAKGVAHGARLGSLDFANLFPESNTFYTQKAVAVVNHSYGTVVENFYGNEAMGYDMSATANPQLVQVFSAGNAGAQTPTTGLYAGVPGMANLTGNFKQSKNSIAVAALDSFGNAMATSSKGPAYDGRVKPDLSAYGEDGSSGAAALVSGTAALVQQAYKQMNGSLPPSALTKAILINSATDVGARSVDYSTGYGSLNAYAAVQTVLQNRVWQGSLTQGDRQTFSLAVPAGLSGLKLTLCWTDIAAGAGITKALVNDLDAVLVNTTTGESWRPWVLNPSPARDSLLQLPQRKRDTLNNVEQITIDAPSAGTYQLQVNGTRVTTSAQAFAVAYSMDTAQRFAWDYPVVGDALSANTKHVLRWSSTFVGSGVVDYSYNGTVWQTIASPATLSALALAWATPDTTATIRLRMTIGGQPFLSDTIVLSKPLRLQVGFNCNDSFQLYWTKLPVAAYRLYRLGENYLEQFAATSDTSIVLRKAQQPSLHYAVAPVVGGREGIRSTTVLYPATGVGCYLTAFYLQSQSINAASFVGELGTLVGVRQVELQKQTTIGFATIQTIAPGSTNLLFTDAALMKGESRYRLRLVLENGGVVFSDVEVVYNLAGSNVYVYPNPVRQSEALRIISTEPGRYTIRIISTAGVEVYRQAINNSYLTIQAVRLPVGLYAVWVMDSKGKPSVQKLIVQ